MHCERGFSVKTIVITRLMAVWKRELTHSTESYTSVTSSIGSVDSPLSASVAHSLQSCPWVGLTHGLDWIGLGWVHYSKSTKNLKGLCYGI